MGNLCASCCQDSSTYEDLTPDPEVRRQQQVEAAERRMKEQEQRGIGNVDAVKRQQQKSIAREQQNEQLATADRDIPLKWQVN
ncbi:small VCP/p97-interacting protein [Chelonus insularis]|uniref:small VCP/p97-interacting protein n=1 Tax=Chelonus insularis TaxID=460826 RepID=UPI00158EAB7F|nr:small VCP/p97-interacting protein [Chelonus insularis]